MARFDDVPEELRVQILKLVIFSEGLAQFFDASRESHLVRNVNKRSARHKDAARLCRVSKSFRATSATIIHAHIERSTTHLRQLEQCFALHALGTFAIQNEYWDLGSRYPKRFLGRIFVAPLPSSHKSREVHDLSLACRKRQDDCDKLRSLKWNVWYDIELFLRLLRGLAPQIPSTIEVQYMAHEAKGRDMNFLADGALEKVAIYDLNDRWMNVCFDQHLLKSVKREWVRRDGTVVDRSYITVGNGRAPRVTRSGLAW